MMNATGCTEFRRRLADLATGSWDDPEEPLDAAMELHAATCVACRARLDAVRRVQRRDLDLAVPTDETIERIVSAVATETRNTVHDQSARRLRRGQRPLVVHPALALAAMVILVVATAAITTGVNRAGGNRVAREQVTADREATEGPNETERAVVVGNQSGEASDPDGSGAPQPDSGADSVGRDPLPPGRDPSPAAGGTNTAAGDPLPPGSAPLGAAGGTSRPEDNSPRENESPSSGEVATVEVHLTLEAPGATSVAVAGDWNGWDTGVHRLKDTDGDGIWELNFRVKAGREYEYQFVVDETQWVHDPRSYLRVEDGFGGTNSILDI
ncbi:MAG: hypothetical protein ACOCYQ_03425 [Alkalispirochaeta sp.]